MTPRSYVVATACAALMAPAGATAQTGQDESIGGRTSSLADTVTSARIDGLSRLWGRVKYFHPWLAYRHDVDWDAALVSAVPRVVGAATDSEYAAALGEVLDALGDPATRIASEADTSVAGHVATSAGQRLTDDGILVLRVGSYGALSGPEAQAALGGAQEALPAARAVVLDLRSAEPASGWAAFQLPAWVGPFERRLIGAPLEPPSTRRRAYYGFPSAQPFASGQYRFGLLTVATPAISPVDGARDLPTVVLLNRHSAFLPGTVASQAAGRSRIVFEGEPDQLPAVGVETIDLTAGLQARIRTAEAIFPDGTDASLIPDTIVPEPDVREDAARVDGADRAGGADPPDAADPALELALALARDFEPSAVERRRIPASGSPRRDRSYPDMAVPDAGHRILGLARLWNAVEHFYPYKHLLDASWDRVQRDHVAAFLAAETALAYAEAVAEMSTRIQDSHTYLAGGAFGQLLGVGFPPVRVRWIEDSPVVTGLRHADRAEGVQVGDVVLRVDGEDAVDRLRRYVRLTSASTEASRIDKAALQFMNGPVGSRARLALRGADGRERTVEVERLAEDYTTLYNRERTGDVVRVLEGDVGYVDLDRLEPDGVAGMFERLADTRAIVFDMRGYPRGTVWWIAPHLADAERTAALFTTPMPGHGSPEPSGETFRQVVRTSADGQPRYVGRTVMLIDERTQSQAEHTGLHLRAANGTLFVGSPSAGANGEVTTVTLPGGLTVGFTGQSVRHPDGRELQRVGLVPDVEARPTLAGIRAGRDEVLEAALEFLRETGG